MSDRVPTQGQTTASPVAAGSRGGGGEAAMVPPAEPRSYYGQSVINPPVWSPEIPWYFWIGGLAGASAPLALLAHLSGNRPLARRAQAAALAGSAVSPVLLIKDLGRPERFLYMLRVFKPSSPMSVGSWILSGFGTTAAAASATELLGLFPRVGRPAQAIGALLGPGLSTYTATLISQTSVPAWHEARRELPFVFAGSSLASAGGLAALATPVRHAAPARRMALLGAALELGATETMERRLGSFLGEPYHQGPSGRLARTAKAATLLGALALGAGAGRHRAAAVAGGGALVAGALAERWAIFKAGHVSAIDPRYTVRPQRERLRRRGAAA